MTEWRILRLTDRVNTQSQLAGGMILSTELDTRALKYQADWWTLLDKYWYSWHLGKTNRNEESLNPQRYLYSEELHYTN